MKYLAGVLLLFAGVACSSPQAETEPLVVKVAVINFDPVVGDSTLHQRFGWQNPKALAEEYQAAISEISHNRVRLDIVSWQDESVFPIKTDGFVYSLEEFEQCWETRTTCHDPDGIDYLAMFSNYNIAQRIDAGEMDEVWIFGAPYMGFWESSMAGPGAFYINGGVFEEVEVSKPFAIMGFSYERRLAEMIHNLCHRTEATMEKVSGGWDTTDLSTDWAKFAANAHQSNGVAAVGSCHYPPNGVEDYDYDNLSTVWSSASAWMDYPHLEEKADSINADTWGGPEYHLNYMKWWFSHLPHASGPSETGILSNWWAYIFHFQENVIETANDLP